MGLPAPAQRVIRSPRGATEVVDGRPRWGTSRPGRLLAAWRFLALFRMVRLGLEVGKASRLGVASLVWHVTPHKLKLVAVGLVAFAAILFAGALAAITLLALQLA